tara:strand:- start:781 stop:1110 length:330 start_codon:yes stop_codon:yes gene_type:complete
MSINQEKFSKINQLRKNTHRQVSDAVSQLNTFASDAMNQQAYMRVNPDLNGADQLLSVVTPDFVAVATAFNEVKEKLEDMQSVASGLMTVDEMIAKHSIDLSQYSNELI